jgi:all-trans-retinol 13,14-reductase
MSKKLYKKYTNDTDFSDVDHIVIGSGIGGLTAETWLAKAGEKVVVFERHYVPGGFTHSFKRKKGFQWDVGVHYVGNVSDEGSLRKLFDFISSGRLDWESMGEVYDVVNIGGDTYEFKAGKEQLRSQLISYFPKEADSIDAYFHLLEKANKRGSAFFFEKTFKPFLSKTIGWFLRKRYKKFSQRTTLEVLGELTENKRLVSVLCAQCGNYGLSPKYSSFGAHALVVNHFIEGGYYPVGGADRISLETIETLYEYGGKVYINADVSEIITENNRVKGVKIGDRFIACKSVISNVGIDNTFNRLVSEKVRKRCHFDLGGVESSTGHICLYVGLDRSDSELNLPKNNIWYFQKEDFDETIDNITLAEAPQQFAYISFPSSKDPAWDSTHPHMSTIQAISVGR